MRLAWVVLLVGCGEGAASGPSFLGTWSFTEGTNHVICPNGATDEPLTGSITIEAIADGIRVLDPAGCNFSYSLDGDTARLGDDKSCSFPVPELGAGVTANVTYDEITLVTDDGIGMTDVFAGEVTYLAPSGALDCAFSGSATLAKVE